MTRITVTLPQWVYYTFVVAVYLWFIESVLRAWAWFLGRKQQRLQKQRLKIDPESLVGRVNDMERKVGKAFLEALTKKPAPPGGQS